MVGSAVELGAPEEIARQAYSDNNEPHIMIAGFSTEKAIVEQGYILLPVNFASNALAKPIDFGKVTWLGSQVRDFYNNRLGVDVT